MNKIRRVLVYMSFLAVCVLLILEIGLRISGNYRTYAEQNRGHYASDFGTQSKNLNHTYTPNTEFTLEHEEFSFPYHINSLGFRERELSSKDSVRIFVFGDSFTEGVGADYASTWPRYLEKLLKDSIPNAAVYVCATSGADPFFNLHALKDLMVHQPSHVVFAVNSTDLTDHVNRGGMERFDKKEGFVVFKDAPWFHPFFRYSHLVRYYLINRKGYDLNLNKTEEWPEKKEIAAKEIAACLKEAQRFTAEHGIKFLALTHPMPHILCSGDTSSPMEVAVYEDYFSELNVLHISEEMEAIVYGPDCMQYGWPLDGHFNARGYELMANIFYGAVQRKDKDFWSLSTAE